MGLNRAVNSKKKLVVATRNQGKIEEISAYLHDLPLEVISLLDYTDIPDIVETGATFEENALIKARTVSAHTGELTMADDSGLEVDCLGGAPGVYSARFAGSPGSDAQNNAKLLDIMSRVPVPERGARFRCVMAIVQPGGDFYIARGSCEGVIAEAAAGEAGFGYDPLFYLPGLSKTMAQLKLEEKNRISHRALALAEAKAILGRLLEG